MWIYGVGGIIVPFIGIKLIDLILVACTPTDGVPLMLVHIRRAVVLVVAAVVLTFAYAFLGTGVSQLLFKHQADGSITANGSTLIGQNWSQTPCPGHRLGTCVFQGRPDAVGPYAGSSKPVAAGGDNPLQANNIPGKPGVLNPGESGEQPRSPLQGAAAEHEGIGGLLEGSRSEPDTRPGHHLGQRVRPRYQPAGRSGPDPHGVQGNRALGFRASRNLVISQTQGAELGFLGTSYIDVLQLNEALAKLEVTTDRHRGRGTRAGGTRCAERSSRWRPTQAALDADRCRRRRRDGNALLRFVGRAAVPGLAVGRRVIAQGTPGLVRGEVVMVNPLYSFVTAE